MRKRFGIIGGNGWLGNAMAHAAVTSRFVEASHLTLSRRSENRGAVEIPGAYWTKDNGELAQRSDIIVLSVRPDQFGAVRIDARGKLILSVMAGVPAAKIIQRTGSERVIRSLPNAAASIRKSFTPWFGADGATAEDKEIAQRFLATFGEAAQVTGENLVDYCVGLTGSGAAFPAMLAQAMIEHAVSQGLSPEFARRAAEGVIVNASQLLSGRDPKEIVDEMIAYRGTTAAALNAMREGNFAGAVEAGLDAAFRKATAMARD